MTARVFSIDLNRYDEERWKTATVITALVILLAYILINIIKVPQNPVKPKEVVEFDFIAPEIKKKVIEIKPKEIKPQQLEEKVLKETPEVVLNIFIETPSHSQALPQNLPFSDQFKVFEQESREMEHAKATIQITDGMMLEETVDNPLDIKKGFASDVDNDNIRSTVITPDIGDRSLKGNMGISTTIPMNERVLSTNFKGFQGDIPWEDVLDPLLNWISKNSSPIGQVPMFKLSKNDPQAITTRQLISVENKKYELLISAKIEKKQITICLIDLDSGQYVMLVDQGLTKTSTIFNTGKIRRDERNEIVHFREGVYKNAQDPEAQNFMKIFWQWARTVTERG
ncbi:MAG: hypothetical protein ONB13_05095 [candidate division KSB1 bacterium]|nr:hypothetical protein [candidate division KSB1 bacterium]MDZ7336239.1 hypothetical protein [candidate division KSB1 bacterium]MDZ7357270.1 hypothetical protein [candidate division KSB1 bacterium]MDZ7375978.1 hypothetical protein [candidate division KSB1 bacterium]MDZ7402102.1 hypothetical protein [candidate division KSB1 bacterium]